MSLEAEVELEVVQPGNLGIDLFFLKFVRDILIISPPLDVPSFVIGHDDGIADNTDVSYHSSEERLGLMRRIPCSGRLADPLAQLAHRGLGQQRHRHLPVTNIE